MGVVEQHRSLLKVITAVGFALSCKFAEACNVFELKELALTGTIIRNNPLEFLH